jgi:hypothetical protein
VVAEEGVVDLVDGECGGDRFLPNNWDFTPEQGFPRNHLLEMKIGWIWSRNLGSIYLLGVRCNTPCI